MSTLARNDGEVRIGAALARIETEKGEFVRVNAGDGFFHSINLVIMSLGGIPNMQLAKSAGKKLALKDGIVINDHQKTSDSSIWVCGDCCQLYKSITDRETYIPMGTTTNKQGRVAGGSIVGDSGMFIGVLGYTEAKAFDPSCAATGGNLDKIVQHLPKPPGSLYSPPSCFTP